MTQAPPSADGAQGIDTATPHYAIYEYWAIARPVCWAMARPPDLAPLNRAFNPCTLGLNYPNALTDLGPNQTNAPQNALKMPAHCAQKCAQNTNTIRAPNTFQNAFENAFECPPLLLTLASAAPPRTAAAPARPRSPPRSWRPRRRML